MDKTELYDVFIIFKNDDQPVSQFKATGWNIMFEHKFIEIHLEDTVVFVSLDACQEIHVPKLTPTEGENEDNSAV